MRYNILLTTKILTLTLLLASITNPVYSNSPEKKTQDKCATLTLGFNSQPASFDPHGMNFTPDINLRTHTHEALFEFELGQGIKPLLAESWEQKQQNIWIIKLRDDVFFHNGQKLKAQDVIYTFDRILLTKETNPHKEYLKSIKSYRKLDDYTLEITTKYLTSSFLFYLTYIAIIPHNLEISAQDNTISMTNPHPNNLIGTGKYKFDFSNSQELNNIHLVANKDYREPLGNLFNNINIIHKADRAQLLEQLLSNQADVLRGLLPSDFKKIRENLNIEILDSVSMRLMFLHMDSYRDQSPYIFNHDGSPLDKNPFKDIRVRRAFNYAIDRQRLINEVLDGAGTITGQLVPAASTTSTPSIQPNKADIKLAKELLSQAGYKNGFKIHLHTPNDRYIKDHEIAKKVAQMLKAINIETEVVAMPKSVFFPKLLKHDFSFMFFGWTPDDGQVSNSLESLLMTQNLSANQGIYNTGRYSNPELDKIITNALNETSNQKKLQLLRYATETAMQDYPIIPLYFQPNIFAYNKNKMVINNTNRLATHYSAIFFECASQNQLH